MPNYSKCDQEVIDIMQEMMHRYHHELEECGVTIDLLFAYAKVNAAGDKVGPAVTLHGYACAAKVRKIGLKDRAKGMADAEIIVDGDRWSDWSETQRQALLDHELTHLELATDKTGAVKRDDLNRPVLKMRKHDFEFGWFDCIAERHGAASFEVQQATTLMQASGQLYFGFGRAPTPAEKVREVVRANQVEDALQVIEEDQKPQAAPVEAPRQTAEEFLAGEKPAVPAPEPDEKVAQLTAIAKVISDNPKAAIVTGQMLEIREKFKRFAAKGYGELIRIASTDICIVAGPGGNTLSAAIKLATKAIEETGDYRKMQCYVAAAVEMTEAKDGQKTPERFEQPANAPQLVRESEAQHVITCSGLALAVAQNQNETWAHAFLLRYRAKKADHMTQPWTGSAETREDAIRAAIDQIDALVAKDAKLTIPEEKKVTELNKAMDDLQKKIAVKSGGPAPELRIKVGPKPVLKPGRNSLLTTADAGAGSALVAGA